MAEMQTQEESGFCPQRGDVIWISFNPPSGSELYVRRPALVISPAEYNHRTGMVLLCPITRRVTGYPFEVPIPDGLRVDGAILADQVKSVDWKARKAHFFCTLPAHVMHAVRGKLGTLIV